MKKLGSLVFGPAGVPITAPARSTLGAIPFVKKLGLGCMELEFVRGVRMGGGTARKIGVLAEKNNIILSAHGPYYINLNSRENSKVEASIKRILDTARITSLANGYSITFHPAYYMGVDKQKVYKAVKSHLKSIIRQLKTENISIWVRPETTGKASQFGDVDELVKLGSELDMVMPCIDFAHLHARSNGGFNTYKEFCRVLDKVEAGLGKKGLDNMHIHLSGIEYGTKGEKYHLVLKESDMNYKDLLRALKKYECKGVVISESPNLEKDALLMKEEYDSL